MAAAMTSAWKIIPSLRSRSIEATIKFYVDELGFTLGGTQPEDEEDDASQPKGSCVPTSQQPTLGFCSIYAGPKAAANIYFFKTGAHEAVVPGEVLIALGTEQVDELHEHLEQRGRVEIVEGVADKPWGYRQFSIKDIDGNRLTFFRFLEGGNPGE